MSSILRPSNYGLNVLQKIILFVFF